MRAFERNYILIYYLMTNMKRKIIKSAIAVLIASSIVTAVWAQYHMENTMNKNGLTEVKEFILSLPADKQDAMATLHETHRNEMKALLDSYKDVERTETIQTEMKAKMKELHAQHLSEVKALLVGVEWADEIIAKMEEKHETMINMSDKMDMMSGSWNMDMSIMKHKMNMEAHKGMMMNKGEMGDMKKRDNAKKVMAHKAKYDKKIGKTLAKVTDDTLSKLLTKLDTISKKIQNDTSFTDTMKNDYLDKIEALRDIITAEIGN